MYKTLKLLLLSLVLAHAAASAPVEAAATPWVDFEVVDGLVVIPTQIQGIEGYSVIDTGAQFTGIAEHFVESNDLRLTRSEPLRIIGVNGAKTLKAYKNVPVTLMSSELVFGKVIQMDLGPRPQLLIGGDFLRTLYFQFDYPNKRMRAISREVFNLKKLSNVKSKLDPGSRQPIAKVRLNDEHDIWLVIDTGNSGGVLMERAVPEKRGWLEDYPSEQITTRGVITTAGADQFRLPVMSIGPYNVKNARVTVPLPGERLEIFKNQRGAWGTSDRRPKSKGLLGYDVLKNFVVTFDYKTGSIFVELPEEARQQTEASRP